MGRFSWFSRSAGTAADTARGTSGLTDAARAAGGLTDATDAARAAGGLTDATDAARAAGSAAEAGEAAKQAQKAAKKAKKATKASEAAKKSSFLSRNAGNLLTAGIAAGGLYYLDQKYKDAKEEVKDCMKVCLPDNWDDHAYGDLEKSELKYKELSDVGTDEQPICTAEIDECGAYCGDKCKEIHDYDAPGSNVLTGLAGDAGETAGGLLNSLFGGLFEGMGLDTSMVGYASSASSSMICMIMMIIILK
jgi:hypothetical protein